MRYCPPRSIMKKCLLLPFLVLVVANCGATDEQLRARAAFDFKCSQGSIHIVEIDGRTRGVSGCGQQGTYVESCSGPPGAFNRDCTWVLNSDSRASQ
jgi:hypothetical protein